MKYCFTYDGSVKYTHLNEIDEINIKFRKEDTTLLAFLLEHKHQRINIYIENILDFIADGSIEIFKAIKQGHPQLDFALVLPGFTYDDNFISTLKEHSIKFYFQTFVSNWDVLHDLAQMGVSDMFITEILGFELMAVKSILDSYGVKVRCFANVAQSAAKNMGLKTFFIRPEDVEYYSAYVDCIEFFGPRDRQEVFYKIYKIDGKWFGKLNEIIIGLDSTLDSRNVLKEFAKRRASCGKRCLKGSPCNLCGVMTELSETLEKGNLILTSL